MIFIKDDIAQLNNEARNCVALDTGCTNSVAGKSWLDTYLQKAGKESKREMIEPLSSNKTFKLGGMLRSTGSYLLLIKVAGKRWVIELDMIKASIPLMISKGTMKEKQKVMKRVKKKKTGTQTSLNNKEERREGEAKRGGDWKSK